jgi:hypothetical protein
MNTAYNEDEDFLLQNNKILIIENTNSEKGSNSENEKINSIKSIHRDHILECYIYKKITNLITLSLLLFTFLLLPFIFSFDYFYNTFKPRTLHFQISFEIFIGLWVLILCKFF